MTTIHLSLTIQDTGNPTIQMRENNDAEDPVTQRFGAKASRFVVLHNVAFIITLSHHVFICDEVLLLYVGNIDFYPVRMRRWEIVTGALLLKCPVVMNIIGYFSLL